MGINAFVKSALTSSLDTFDAEDVTINGETKRGVIEDLGSLSELGEGGDRNERTIRVSFPGASFTTTPASGKYATCRGKKWQIETVDDSPGVLVITLEEQERRTQ